jgi:Uma2 family endonuclease
MQGTVPMTIATQIRMSLEEYLTYDDGTDTRYELVDGVLVEMGAESDLNVTISGFLFAVFLQLGIPHYCLRRGTEIATPKGSATSRYPDVMVLTEAGRAALIGQKQSIVREHMPPPALVVEVVSPGPVGSENYKRDYQEKPIEYAARGIPEYWIIDPERQIVLVLSLVEGAYQPVRFTRDQRLESTAFPALQLTANQVLAAGESE